MTLPRSFLEKLQAGESQTLEFKTSFDKATIESLVAFANTKGGSVLVGVKDNGDVQGITLGKETLNEWLGQIKSATSPALIPDLETEVVNGKTVVIICMPEFPVKPVNTRGRYFKRVASSNHQLGLSEISDMYMQSLQLSWDAYVAPNTPIEALALPKIKRFINQVNTSGRFALDDEAPMAALEKLKYTVNGQPTWAALLLFAKDPQRHHVHIGRFKTPSMIIDDRQFTDTLFEVVEQSMQFIVSHISVAFEFDGSIQRKERFAYPLPALREALLNAVVHRSYTNPNDIQIKIFDDSIAIYSPGAFYGDISVADLQTDSYKSSLRNKLVAEAFYLTNNIEKYGSGFIRIRKALRDYPEISFEVKEIGAGIELIFRQCPISDETTLTPTLEKSSVESSVESSVKIIHLIAQQPDVTAKELAQKLSITLRAVEKQLAKLKRQGRLVRVGANKGGHWQVQKGAN